jgi:hypothetical protein
MRIKESVTPSGVAFSVRALTGYDQNTISKKNDNPGDQFNKMIMDCLMSLGTLSKDMIKIQHVEKLLTNDRKFILVTLRQFSLKFQKEFKFKFEWPLRKGSKVKEVEEREVTFDEKSFPIVPYKWMIDKISAIGIENETVELETDKKAIPDGFAFNYPVLYESYDQMLAENKIVKGTFPEGGANYQFELLDAAKEKVWSPVLSNEDDIVVNMMIEMHSPKIEMKTKDGGALLTKFEPGSVNSDILDVEHIRKHIKDVEGAVDTSLTIQHFTDVTRVKRVDLVTLVDFSFGLRLFNRCLCRSNI